MPVNPYKKMRGADADMDGEKRTPQQIRDDAQRRKAAELKRKNEEGERARARARVDANRPPAKSPRDKAVDEAIGKMNVPGGKMRSTKGKKKVVNRGPRRKPSRKKR